MRSRGEAAASGDGRRCPWSVIETQDLREAGGDRDARRGTGEPGGREQQLGDGRRRRGFGCGDRQAVAEAVTALMRVVLAGSGDAETGDGGDHGDAVRPRGPAQKPARRGFLPVRILEPGGERAALAALPLAALRLDAGQPYRFRMMTLDVSHGASIQFGRGGRMVRLRPGRLTEAGMTFERPGRYLMTCTLYCGAAHDLMQATIEVV